MDVRASRELDCAPPNGSYDPRTRHVAGEYIADCSDNEHLGVLGQLFDTPIRVREGDAVGYGIMESLIAGVWPELGLTAESDHKVSYG